METVINPNALEPYRAVIFSNGNKYGSEATFACNDGFKIDGPSSITCDAVSLNDSWPTAPACNGVSLRWRNRPSLHEPIKFLTQSLEARSLTNTSEHVCRDHLLVAPMRCLR